MRGRKRFVWQAAAVAATGEAGSEELFPKQVMAVRRMIPDPGERCVATKLPSDARFAC